MPIDRAERISINAFGLGGSNAHIILESARSLDLSRIKNSEHQLEGQVRTPPTTPSAESRKELLVYTANRAESASMGLEQLRTFITDHPEMLQDVAYTLSLHREHLPWRTFALSSGEDIVEFQAPVKAASTNFKSSTEMVFVFTGQGAQWATSKSHNDPKKNISKTQC